MLKESKGRSVSGSAEQFGIRNCPQRFQRPEEKRVPWAVRGGNGLLPQVQQDPSATEWGQSSPIQWNHCMVLCPSTLEATLVLPIESPGDVFCPRVCTRGGFMQISYQEATVCDLWARTVSRASEETTTSRPCSLAVLRHNETHLF